MTSAFPPVFEALKPILVKHEKRMTAKSDPRMGYSLYSKAPSPFPQHKGQPLFFAALRTGKAYVSFHLMPLYMCPALTEGMSPELKKRMQGKACFNFKTVPDPALIQELKRLTANSIKQWTERKWL